MDIPNFVDDIKKEIARKEMERANLALEVKRLKAFLELAPEDQEVAALLMITKGELHEKIREKVAEYQAEKEGLRFCGACGLFLGDDKECPGCKGILT